MKTIILTLALLTTFSTYSQSRGGQQRDVSQIHNYNFGQLSNRGVGPNSRGSNPVVLNNVSRGNSNLSIQSSQALNNVSDNNVNFIANNDIQVNFNSNPRQSNSNRNQGQTNKLRNIAAPKQMNQKNNHIIDNNRNEQMIQIAVVVEQKQAKERKQIELTSLSLPSPKSIDMPKIEMTILPSINKAEKITNFELKKHKTGIYIQPKFLKKKVFNPTKAWFKRNFKSKGGKRNKTRKLSCCF